jgi:hypothetical protein
MTLQLFLPSLNTRTAFAVHFNSKDFIIRNCDVTLVTILKKNRLLWSPYAKR